MPDRIIVCMEKSNISHLLQLKSFYPFAYIKISKMLIRRP